MSLARWTSQIKNTRWTWDDTVSLGQLKHLRTLLNKIIPSKTWTLYGTSLLFNNQTNSSLGLDGYDNYQAPQENGRQLFDRRMWVSGSLKFRKTPRIGESLRCIERVQLVRRVGDSVFVAVLRETRKLEFESDVEGGSVKVGHENTGDVLVSELRSLVYKWRADVPEKTNSETTAATGSSSPVASKEFDPEASTELTISASQVSRFSALQYNLHKIHYSRDYSLSEGLSDVIVLGPMLVNIMLHYFALVYPKAAIDLFAYRMSEPCYVDRPLRITMENGDKNVEITVWEGHKKLCNGTARKSTVE